MPRWELTQGEWDAKWGDAAARDYRGGKSLRQVASTYHTSAARLRKVLDARGIYHGPAIAASVPPQHIVDLYQSGKHIKDIAKELSIGNDLVIAALNDAGVERRPPRGRRIPPDRVEDVVARYLSGESPVKIAADFGVHQGTVKLTISRIGVPLRHAGAPYRELDPATKGEIIAAARDGDSLEGMSRRFGTSSRLVRKILFQAGLPTSATDRRYGSDHHKWGDGRHTTSDGYVMIRATPGFPFPSMINTSGYVAEHRIVMAQHLGRPLAANEQVHHIGVRYSQEDKRNRSDNLLDNLQLRHGNHGTGIALRCRHCGSHDIEAVPLA